MTEALLAFFKAMANESRLKIVGLLAARERSVQELAELTELTEPTVSHHLTALKAVGLVTVRADGNVRWHALDTEALARLNRAVLEPAEVLATFLDPDGRLKVMPASRRKRAVVLAWLAARFEDGRRYAEAEVNAAIEPVWWDVATLRRELIGARMLAREDGVYWRLPEEGWATG